MSKRGLDNFQPNFTVLLLKELWLAHQKCLANQSAKNKCSLKLGTLKTILIRSDIGLLQ